MDEQHIRQALTEIATQEIQDDMNIWPYVKAQLGSSVAPKRRALRLVKIGALAVILVAASAVTYAVYQEIAGNDPGLQAVDRDNKIIYFGETKPITPADPANGNPYQLTVTLDYAYADANRITVAYTARGQASGDESVSVFSNPALTDENGKELYRMPLLGGGGGSGGGGGGGGSSESPPTEFTQNLTANFDASGITGTPEEVRLHLMVELAYSSAETQGGMLLAGSAEFDLRLPFNAGRRAPVEQTVNAGGLDMTLRRVTVSPSLTRLEMCYADPSRDNFLAVPFAQVEIDDALIVPETELTIAGLGGQAVEGGDACRAFDIPAALHQESGEWTVTITRLRLQGSEDLAQVAAAMQAQHGITITPQPGGGFSYDTPANNGEALWQSVDQIVADAQETIDGPWTFRFSLP